MSSIKIRSKRRDGKTQIRILIAHPMAKTSRNNSASGLKSIPGHFIQVLTVKHNGKIIAHCNIGPNIAKNPFFAFMLNGGETGDKISASWVDNQGQTDSAEHRIG
ncbi:MAG: thiosulfate oxidation carrier complex protein SoxZ [Methylomonas sp.]|nr:MAG: thiosulfate oxidation carrier complex protein SoxZ [Methylobacter sp.]PPD36390.1 MAG: thiosulfate oxidation carrier complex protein SoxZ [Methylomonas sp.]